MNDKQKELYNNGTYKNVMQEKKQLYKEGKLYLQEDNKPFGNTIDIDAFTTATEEDVRECLKMRNNRKSRMRPLRDRIAFWRVWRDKTTEIYFVTFTFTDESLRSMSSDTRKQYIRRELSRFCEDYFGNIDFGKENGREHFHFIIVVRKGINPLEELNKLKELGAIKIEKWRTTKYRSEQDALMATVNYTDKLAMHAMKDENNANIISKRGTDYHQFRALGKELGEVKNWVNSVPEFKEKAIHFAELTDHPWWIRYNNMYGNLGMNFCFCSKEPYPELYYKIEKFGELFGEEFEIEHEKEYVTLGGVRRRKE